MATAVKTAKLKEEGADPNLSTTWADRTDAGFGSGQAYGSEERYNESEHAIWKFSDPEVAQLKGMGVASTKDWEIFEWMCRVRADILKIEAHLGIPHGDPRDPPTPPFD